MCRLRSNILTVLLFCSLFWACNIFAAEKNEPNAPKPPMPVTDKDFVAYASQDRRDPFEPIYLYRMKKKSAAGIIEKVGYELEELKLVGVIKTGAVRFAMMEDVQGRGMLFKKGDSLNQNLWLFDILEDKVVLAYKLRGDTRKIVLDITRK
ncbi:MAG: hypothetical protein A4E57_02779 [Syntrophorhabdaceae bacterium PtaU1.Bin034]|nr:MAG: hypothetical protein A4E57_02779 [Syntrophorhabdaceae bacterium PtaU1.Bin034]